MAAADIRDVSCLQRVQQAPKESDCPTCFVPLILIANLGKELTVEQLNLSRVAWRAILDLKIEYFADMQENLAAGFDSLGVFHIL